MLSLLESGLISEGFDQQGVPKVMLQDLQGYVMRGSAASALPGIPVRTRSHHGGLRWWPHCEEAQAYLEAMGKCSSPQSQLSSALESPSWVPGSG